MKTFFLRFGLLVAIAAPALAGCFYEAGFRAGEQDARAHFVVANRRAREKPAPAARCWWWGEREFCAADDRDPGRDL
jgi:hypothetical protein